MERGPPSPWPWLPSLFLTLAAQNQSSCSFRYLKISLSFLEGKETASIEPLAAGWHPALPASALPQQIPVGHRAPEVMAEEDQLENTCPQMQCW